MGWDLPDGCSMRELWDWLDPQEPVDRGALEDEGYDDMRERELEEEK